MDWTTSLRAFSSLIVMTGLLALMSTNRKKIPWALVVKGMLIQFVFAFLILRVSFVANGFQAVGQVFVNILGYTREGSLFLFGSLISNTDSFGYIFAFQVLPTVIFFSAFTSLMYYWGILQKIVWVFAWIMRWTLKVSGAESLAAAGNIFLGQTEAPLLVKPYIGKMTRSELLSLMTGGMATIAGGVLAAYIGYLGGWLAELIWLRLWRIRQPRLAVLSFSLGLLFSILLTLLPAVAAVSWVAYTLLMRQPPLTP